MQNFSSRLEAALAASGLSKGDFADRLKVAASTVSRWFGGAIPKAETVAEMAAVLGVDAKWLLIGEGQMMPKPHLGPQIEQTGENKYVATLSDGQKIPFSVNTPGLDELIPGSDALARWYIESLSTNDAAELVSKFMQEYQNGDAAALLRADAIIKILRKKAP